MKKFFLHYPMVWAMVSGVLFGTSYPPFPAWGLFFCMAPLWLIWFHAKSLKVVLATGFVAQFLFTMIGSHWIVHTAMEYGHLSLLPSIFILIGFCSFASFHIVIAGCIVWKIKQKWPLLPSWFFILLAIATLACEHIYPMIFPWNYGYPLLFNNFHSSQLAEYFGFSFLGLGVLLSNSCFAIACEKYPQKHWSRSLAIFILLLFFAELSGTWVEQNLGIEDKKISALLVQPNIGNYAKYSAERKKGYQAPVINKVLGLTIQGLKHGSLKPDVIVLPETAYPAFLDPYFRHHLLVAILFNFIKKSHIPMITGAYSQDSEGDQIYNAIFAIDPQGDSNLYRKHLLLAFGEYFPGAKWFPFLKTIVPAISDCGRGEGALLFKLGEFTFSPSICYEGLHTQYMSKMAELGAQIFINLSNDSWFDKTFEPYQHMIMTVARTIEFRRPLIRSTNTGLSVVSDARGHLLLVSPQDKEWVEISEVPYFSQPKKTLYSKVVPYLIFISLGLFGLTLWLGIYLSSKDSNASNLNLS